MAVETTITSASLVGNGATTVFPLPFVFLDNEHIDVYLDNILQTGGFSVSGANNPAGGAVTFTAAPANGVVVRRVRNVPITQDVDTVNNETILQDVLDKSLDKLTMIDQQQEAALERTISVPDDEDGFILPDAADRAGKFLAFLPDGTPYAASGTGNDTALRVDLASVNGASAVGFSQNAPGVSGSIAARLQSVLSVKDHPFLATGNGLADDTVAVTSAQTVALATGRPVFLPAGTYLIAASTLLLAKFYGPGFLSLGGRIVNLNDTEAGAQVTHETMFRLGDMSAARTALASGTIKVLFWGDSITEGLSQIAGRDSWPKLLEAEMRRRAPGKTINVENFSISGRGTGEANNPAYVGTAGAVTPGTNFNQAAGTTFPIPDPTMWPGGTTPAKSWREHVRDRAPDILVIALSINDTTDPNGVYGNLKSLINNYVLTWAKPPSILLVTPTMPTRLQATQLAQQPFIEGNGHTIRALADELNVSLVDMNRLWFLLRDGVDVARQRMAYYPGLSDNATFLLKAGVAPAYTASMTFSAFGIVHRPVLHRDLDCRVDMALTGTQVGAIWARSNPADPNKAYVVQVERGAPQVALYYNSVSLGTSALAAQSNYKVRYVIEGARHRVWVDDVLRIDVINGQRTEEGYSGFQGDTGVVLSNPYFQLGYPRVVSHQTMDESLLLGSLDDYASNPRSLGGNALNHPSIVGHYEVFGAFHGFLDWLQDAASSLDLSAFEQNITLVNGANQNIALPKNAKVVVSGAPTANYSIGGIAGGVLGKQVKLFNYTLYSMTLNHQDGGSSVGNRFILPGSANKVIPSFGTADLTYIPSANGWTVV